MIEKDHRLSLSLSVAAAAAIVNAREIFSAIKSNCKHFTVARPVDMSSPFRILISDHLTLVDFFIRVFLKHTTIKVFVAARFDGNWRSHFYRFSN